MTGKMMRAIERPRADRARACNGPQRRHDPAHDCDAVMIVHAILARRFGRTAPPRT
jgi:hypothetical protein